MAYLLASIQGFPILNTVLIKLKNLICGGLFHNLFLFFNFKWNILFEVNLFSYFD